MIHILGVYYGEDMRVTNNGEEGDVTGIFPDRRNRFCIFL